MKKRKRKAPLNEARAWAVLALLFGKRFGFCRAIGSLECEGLIDEKTADKMTRRFASRKSHPAVVNAGYKWPMLESAGDKDDYRIDFAERTAARLRKRK